MTFRELHQQEQPLLICNVWDVASAQTAERLKFQAIATSSSAIAATWGYNDGEELSFDELFYVVKHITSKTSLPVSVDLEAGYSDSAEGVVQNLKVLSDLGVVGVNLEDSQPGEHRSHVDSEIFAKKLSTIKNLLEKDNIDIFLNIRTDAFLLEIDDPLKECQKRIPLFEEAGADGIFVPFIISEEDIQAVTSLTKLPINVLSAPNLPGFDHLQTLGVKRISMGGSVYFKLNKGFEEAISKIRDHRNFHSIHEK